MSEHEKATPRPWYHETLDEIEDYFDQRADADHNGVSYAANKEMLCLQAVCAVKRQLTRYDASRALIEQMRDALRVADRLDSWAYSSAIAGYQQANRREEEFGRKIDAAKEQVAGALAAAEKFLKEGQ